MVLHTRPRLCALIVAALAAVLTLSGCSWFGSDDKGQKSVSVFDVKPGQCFVAPSKVKAELSDLTAIACTKAHTQEAYAVVPYAAAGAGSTGSASASVSADAYPGGTLLEKYAKGVCAQRFTAYVGVDYLDSKLFYTYLLPSARSWEQNDDRDILCFITTTGGTLTTSVKGSKR